MTVFCFGSGITWATAIASPDIKAAGTYYGSVARMDDLAKIRAAGFAIYAAEDPRITRQRADVEEKLKTIGRPYETKVYPNTRHGFFNDTRESYPAEAARQDWQDTLTWVRRHLTA